MKRTVALAVVSLFVALLPVSGRAEFKPEAGSIDGYMVADYFYLAQHHNEEDLEGRNGFWFRRIYFTYNNRLGENIKVRLRLEMNSPGDFSSSSLNPYVKDAYLDVKLAEGLNLIAGIQGPPALENIESVWGYRSLEKIPLDLYKWTSSRDFGLSIKGGKEFIYQVMFGQGSGNKSEADKGKKIYGMVGYKTGGFHLEVNGAYEKLKEVWTDYFLHGHASYSGKWGRVAVEYAHRQEEEKVAGGENPVYEYNILSAFVVLSASKKLDIIARYDLNSGDGYINRFKGSGVDYIPFEDYFEPSLFIGAISYNVFKNVWLIPNIKYSTYRDPGDGREKPGNDLYTNLTLYFKF